MIQDNHLGDDRSTNVLRSTELTGSSDNTENFYSGDYNFESWLGQLGQLRFSVLLLSPSSNMQDSTQNQALTTSFHITANSLFMTILWCTVSLLILAFNKDKGKAVPICTIKVCVLVGGRANDVAFIVLVLNLGYGMDGWMDE